METVSHSGAAVTSIPILAPPGRAGLAPSLSLTYTSYAKNGWIGVGFGLEPGAIQRSTKWGLDYQGREFTASLGGAGAELVPRPDWGSQMYGARIEGAFVKYLFKGANRRLGGLGQGRKAVLLRQQRRPRGRRTRPTRAGCSSGAWNAWRMQMATS